MADAARRASRIPRTDRGRFDSDLTRPNEQLTSHGRHYTASGSETWPRYGARSTTWTSDRAAHRRESVDGAANDWHAIRNRDTRGDSLPGGNTRPDVRGGRASRAFAGGRFAPRCQGNRLWTTFDRSLRGRRV